MGSVIQRKSYNENLVDARVLTITATESPTMVTLTTEDTRADETDGNGVFEISNVLENARLHDELLSTLVDTPAAIASLVDSLSDLPDQPPSIYVDLEGFNLSRHGSISILQIHVLPTNLTYLIDVYTLGKQVFSTIASNERTLKSIFESTTIPKAFFDIRNDSDALYSLYGVKVAGIHDIQLMELATRSFSKRCINGLAKCIERDIPMNERREWMVTKERGRRLFAPECGGSYEVFNTRPLPDSIREYCMQDVQLLPRLWVHYSSKMTPQWRTKVENATQDRIQLSQSANFNGKGRHMALGPWP
jgi:exonuclease 3'-5' domain-containing protein 1